MYNHNKAQRSKNRVHISCDILYMSSWVLVNLFNAMIFFSNSAPKLFLIKWGINVSLRPMVEFEQNSFFSVKGICKYRLQNIGQYVQVSVCWIKVKPSGTSVVPKSGIDGLYHIPYSCLKSIRIFGNVFDIANCYKNGMIHKLRWLIIVVIWTGTILPNKNWGWRNVFIGFYLTEEDYTWIYM